MRINNAIHFWTCLVIIFAILIWLSNLQSLSIGPAVAEAQCALSCPADITVGNDPNQCSAVVNFADPTGDCEGVGVTPPSGSFFPIGTTTVTAFAAAGESCTFTVTVIDVQPPNITCPADITVDNDPNKDGAVVNYVVPASDNCPGFVLEASPPSGSFFPIGTTNVTATATDTRQNQAFCRFNVTVKRTNATGIPTLTEWGMIIMSLMLAGIAIWMIRRRQTA
jgi:hypothetical protein